MATPDERPWWLRFLTSPVTIKLAEIAATVAVGAFVKNAHSKTVANDILATVENAQSTLTTP